MKGMARSKKCITVWSMLVAMVITVISSLAFTQKVDAKETSVTGDTEYISEIACTCSSLSGGKEKAKAKLTSSGYTLIDRDLNAGAGGDYIYMGYKTTKNPDEAITDIISVNGSKEEEATKPRENYEIINWLENPKKPANMNEGAKKYVFLFVSRDKKQGSPICNIFFNDQIADAWTDDLNRGAGGDDIFTHGKRRVAFYDNTADVEYDGQEHTIDVVENKDVKKYKATNYEIIYSKSALDPFTDKAPTFTEIGDHTVYWHLKADNLESVDIRILFHLTRIYLLVQLWEQIHQRMVLISSMMIRMDFRFCLIRT